MSQSLLERLPGEVITQIVETLNTESPSSVFKLLFIRITNLAAQRAIYTTLAIPPTGPHNPSPIVKHLIDLILNPNSPIPNLIRSLQIPQWTSYSFSEIFRAQLPELRCLNFTITEAANFRTISKFLDSIKGLEELTVTTSHSGFYPIIWSQVQRHGPTLRFLKTNSDNEPSWNWTRGALEELLASCSRLESLSVDLKPDEKSRVESKGVACASLVLPCQSFTLLSRLSHLRTLKIATVLENPGRGGLGSILGVEVAKEMFKDFYRYHLESKLRNLELKIRKVEYAAIQETHVYTNIVTVTRIEGERSPLEGGFEAVVSWTEGDGRVNTYKS